MAVLITAATIATVNAQPPALGAPPSPRPDARGIRPPHPPRGEQLQPVSQFQGRVVKISVNDDYVYDGFYMLTGSDSVLVKFPPHLGSQITSSIKNGSSVTVNGVMNYSPFGEKEIKMVSINANGQTIYDAPPAATPIAVSEKFINGSGTISNTQTDREGRINGFILNDNAILRIPPDVIYQLSVTAKTGATIDYTGTLKQLQTGEVAAGNYKIVHCNTIKINGQQYLVR